MIVGKRFKIEIAHKLDLPYESKCKNIHGHTEVVEVMLYGDVMEDGMVIDFSDIGKIRDELDHKFLNGIIKQPTAENIAKYIADRVARIVTEKGRKVYGGIVRVYETENNWVEYGFEIVDGEAKEVGRSG